MIRRASILIMTLILALSFHCALGSVVSMTAIYKTKVNTTPLAISAGYGHTCVVLADGSAKCWGYGGNGRLGNGSNSNSNIPVSVIGLFGGVVDISAGFYHNCAIMATGSIRCWGHNLNGQLGNGTSGTTGVIPPVTVIAVPANAKSIGAVGHHTCASFTNGAAKCWGAALTGQELGNGGAGATNPTPLDISGMSTGVSSVSTGPGGGCAALTSGGLKCWGNNSSGQLGRGSFVNSSVPVDVVGLTSGVASVSSSGGETNSLANTCAVLTSGAVKCWGRNGPQGTLGNGSVVFGSNVPVDVTGLSSGIKQVSVGLLFVCSLSISGAVKCWGAGAAGQLGNGAITNSNVPVDVFGMGSGVKAISAGGMHACAILNSGLVKCWGSNSWGQLGNGGNLNSNIPVTVSL